MIKNKINEIDFFIADEIELSSFSNEMTSMEHPFFTLKGGDIKTKKYVNKNIVLTINANSYGLATIFDKDIWIYVISKLQTAKNKKEKISRKVCFTLYDFFLKTNRDKGGRSYCEIEKALSRLKGTTIKTNISYSDKKEETIEFGLIDSWRIIDKRKGKIKIGMVEIIIPNWLYQALHKKKILKINPHYFHIRKAINRRIYEIARKHCGNQKKFIISLEKLYLKSGSSSLLKMFKYNIKKLIQSNNLPDYKISYNPKLDVIIFTNRKIIK